MSQFPDQLYQPAQADSQKGIVLPSRYLGRFQAVGTASAQSVRSNAVPPDRVLVLSNAVCIANCSTPEFVVSIILRIENETDNEIIYLDDVRSYPPLRSVGLSIIRFNLQQPIVVMPSEKVAVRIIYDSIGASKTTTLDLVGVMYPRGNWQYAPS